jgi:hypothetical protein
VLICATWDIGLSACADKIDVSGKARAAAAIRDNGRKPRLYISSTCLFCQGEVVRHRNRKSVTVDGFYINRIRSWREGFEKYKVSVRYQRTVATVGDIEDGIFGKESVKHRRSHSVLIKVLDLHIIDLEFKRLRIIVERGRERAYGAEITFVRAVRTVA